jgi:hypothetical protein
MHYPTNLFLKIDRKVLIQLHMTFMVVRLKLPQDFFNWDTFLRDQKKKKKTVFLIKVHYFSRNVELVTSPGQIVCIGRGLHYSLIRSLITIWLRHLQLLERWNFHTKYDSGKAVLCYS